MPHPFFEVTAYPWYRHDAVELHTVLYQAFSAPPAIDLWYKRCGGYLPPLTPGNAAHLIWKEALEALTIAGGLRHLCLALQADQTVQNNARFQGAVRAVIEAKDIIEQSYFGEEGDIFLDRGRFRAELSRLRSGSAYRPVLLVRGEASSGKSWSRHMVERLAHDSKADCIYLCQGIVSTLQDVLENLFTSLNAAVPQRADATTSEEAWFRQICLALQTAAQQKGQRWWIVVDDLSSGPEGPRIDPEIRSFFDQFAMSMVNPMFAKRFRLVLIHYPDGPVPTKWKRDLWIEDQTRNSDVQQVHVLEFLNTWARRRRLHLPEDEAARLAEAVITQAEAGAANAAAAGGVAASRIQLIHEGLLAVIDRLGGQLT